MIPLTHNQRDKVIPLTHNQRDKVIPLTHNQRDKVISLTHITASLLTCERTLTRIISIVHVKPSVPKQRQLPTRLLITTQCDLFDHTQCVVLCYEHTISICRLIILILLLFFVTSPTKRMCNNLRFFLRGGVVSLGERGLLQFQEKVWSFHTFIHTLTGKPAGHWLSNHF